ncbi:MAG: Uma2 family endonuclease [Pirellulales bacterium]
MSTLARFELEQYERMIRAGVFDGKFVRHLEFLRGAIVEMNPIGSAHSQCVANLSDWSYEVAPQTEVGIRVQMPLRIPRLNSEPEPDLLWVVRRDYSAKHPEPEDVLLVIEVADSSLEFDRGEKLQLYAEAGIEDYWVVNLIDRCIEIYRSVANAQYQATSVHRGSQDVRPLHFPGATLQPVRVFGA